MNFEMHLCFFWVDDIVHHWGFHVALVGEMKPNQKRDDFIDHGKDNAKCKANETEVAYLCE